jgi:general secretion pathway protein G
MSARARVTARARQGFTLIELLVVIAILGILAGVVAFGVVRYLDEARVKKAKLQVANFKTALDAYKIDVGNYPSQDVGLKALIEPPSDERAAKNWKGPYMDIDKIPLDPWGAEYIYELSTYPGTGVDRVEIISYGKDGAQGGDGYNADISNRTLDE